MTGTPAPFVRRFKTRKRALLALLSPPFLVAAIAWLYWAAHTKVTPGVDLTVLDVSFTTKWALIAGSIGALAGIGALIVVPRQPVYTCECPVCGAQGVRDFSNKNSPPSCGACYAYLRASGRAITEESDEAFHIAYPPYIVSRARYEAVPQEPLRGKPSQYLRFKMPAFCAVCGSEDAKYTRSIHGVHEDRSPQSGGMLSKIADEAIISAEADAGMGRGYAQLKNAARSPMPNSYNKFLRNLEVPVCGPHRENKFEPGENVIADCDGDLGFASYRYYKAFCELNGIASSR